MNIKPFEVSQRMAFHNVKGASISIIEAGKINTVNSFGLRQDGTEMFVNEDSIFNACSISKFATAILALKLVGDGVCRFDQDVNEQLRSWQVPENEYTKASKVTLRNLLCHQAGFIDQEGSFDVYIDESGKPSLVDLLEGNSAYSLARADVKYRPGTDCVYSDMGYSLIELLITDITGKPFTKLIEDQIFKPLGMKHSKIIDIPFEYYDDKFTFGHDKEGQVMENGRAIYPYPAAAGLWCTSNDMALLMKEIFDALKGKSKLGISTALMKEMIKPQGCKSWSGLGIVLDNVESNLEFTSFGWGRGYQCMLIGFPLNETGCVIMTNSDTGVHQMDGFIGEYMKQLYFDGN